MTGQSLIFDADLFAKDARILSFTSEGNKKAWKDYAAVSAAKVALEAITRSIALEFAPKGITGKLYTGRSYRYPFPRIDPRI